MFCIAGAALLVVVTVTFYERQFDKLRAEREVLLNELDEAVTVITGLNKPAPARLRAVK